MTARAPLVMGVDGLPQQMQSGDVVSVAAGGTGTNTSTGSGANVQAIGATLTSPTLINPGLTGIVVASAQAGSNGYFWATGNISTGAGVGLGLGYDGTQGTIGALDWTGGTGGSIARKPLALRGSTIKLQIGTGATWSDFLTLDSSFGNYANDAAAATAGVPVNGLYRNGSALMVRVS